jgi:hypothetical protein
MPTYIWEHIDTGEQREHTTSMSTIDSFLDGVDTEDREKWKRVPQLSHPTRASFVDGRRRDLDDQKEIAKLKVEQAGTRPEKRKEISREIRKLQTRGVD